MVTTVLIALFSPAQGNSPLFRGNTPHAWSRRLSHRIAFKRARSLRIREGIAGRKLDPITHVGADDPIWRLFGLTSRVNLNEHTPHLTTGSCVTNRIGCTTIPVCSGRAT